MHFFTTKFFCEAKKKVSVRNILVKSRMEELRAKIKGAGPTVFRALAKAAHKAVLTL